MVILTGHIDLLRLHDLVGATFEPESASGLHWHLFTKIPLLRSRKAMLFFRAFKKRVPKKMPPMFLKPNVVLSNSWIWRGTEISTGACGSLSVRNSAGPSHLIGWGFTRWRWTNWGVVDFKKCLVQGELNDIDISTDPFLKNQYCFREGIHWLFCGKKNVQAANWWTAMLRLPAGKKSASFGVLLMLMSL